MRYFSLSIFLLLISICPFCQKDSSANIIIEDAILSRKDVKKIVYLDTSINFYQTVGTISKKGKVNGFRDTLEVSIQFSKEEIKFLDAEFKKAKIISWPIIMFKNSIRISQDSLTILSDPKKGPLYFEKNFAKKYFHFSHPVFLRNNSLAVFRLAEMYHPSAGYDLLYFYEKINEKWKQYMVVHLGAW